MIAALVVVAAGAVLAIAQPGDLGGKETTTSRPATTRPTTTGSTTASTTGTTVQTQQTTPATVEGLSTTATTDPVTTTTSAGGLGQSGAGTAGGTQHPITGGESFLWLGAMSVAAALALRRASVNVSAARA